VVYAEGIAYLVGYGDACMKTIGSRPQEGFMVLGGEVYNELYENVCTVKVS
jgi:hypothetical protein